VDHNRFCLICAIMDLCYGWVDIGDISTPDRKNVMERCVVHIITCLSTGGAEMMLYNLLSAMDRAEFKPEVISLTDIGPVGEKIKALGVAVQALGMRRGAPNPLAVLRLARWLRQKKSDLIQTWMYHADLIGGIAARLAGDIPVAWGIHHTNLDPESTKRKTIWTAKSCARLSYLLPTQIVCCSEASLHVHAALGYATRKMCVIPNGFDLDAFKPDPAARRAVRSKLGIAEDALLVGLIARFHPQKDHANFVKAAALLHTRVSNAHFLLCGEGITWENQELLRWIEDAGIREHCHLLGRREDIPRLMVALDIASSSSFGEAFPIVLGEAMACGIPCVVTDVGDSTLIVGKTGKVVSARDPAALAHAWQDLIDIGRDARRHLGEMARKRIEENFSLKIIARRYEALYESLLG